MSLLFESFCCLVARDTSQEVYALSVQPAQVFIITWAWYSTTHSRWAAWIKKNIDGFPLFSFLLMFCFI